MDVLGLVVAVANLALLSVNAAAPVRGLVDPDYVGYGFGWLHADKGLPVTLMAGGVVLGALVSALLVLRNASGPIMILLAAFDGFIAFSVGVPLAAQVLADPSKVAIQFGEYLTIPALVAIPLLVLVFVLPFAAGALIGLKRALGAPAEA